MWGLSSIPAERPDRGPPSFPKLCKERGGSGQAPSLRGVLQPGFPRAGNRPEEGRWGPFKAAFQVRKQLVQVQDLAYLSVRRGSVARSSIFGESVGERDREHHPVVPSGGLICSPPGAQQLVSTRDLSLPLWNLRCFSHCLVNHLGQTPTKQKNFQAPALWLFSRPAFWVGLFALVSWQDVSPCALSLHTNRPAQPYSTSVLRLVSLTKYTRYDPPTWIV